MRPKIKYFQSYNISQSELEKITDLNIHQDGAFHSEGEYSHLAESWLEIIFKRDGVQRKFRVDYRDYSPNDDGDRYSTSYQCDIYCTHPKDPILEEIYNKIQKFKEDGDYSEIYNLINL